MLVSIVSNTLECRIKVTLISNSSNKWVVIQSNELLCQCLKYSSIAIQSEGSPVQTTASFCVPFSLVKQRQRLPGAAEFADQLALENCGDQRRSRSEKRARVEGRMGT
uniref:Uncharacterized protein n=1 Tax=Arundo donax TaxID=35708 RepID=A0A0A9BG65_ARUDO